MTLVSRMTRRVKARSEQADQGSPAHNHNPVAIKRDGAFLFQGLEEPADHVLGYPREHPLPEEFVRLYYDGLSKSERRFVAAPRSMGETIELVDGQRVALVAEEEDFLTALEGDVAKDELQQRLEAVANEVGAKDPQHKTAQ